MIFQRGLSGRIGIGGQPALKALKRANLGAQS
jgi:hypothetical protein